MSKLNARQTAVYEARRVAQTRRTFANWPTLLGQLVGEKVGRGGAELTFVTRSGITLSCPNVPGARLPLYEQFADDCYERDWVLGPATGTPVHVLDVGSHVGAFAINLASARPEVHVECYEPSASSARYLRRNIAQNGLSDRMRVHELALAATVGEALFDDNSSGSVHNGLVREDQRLVDGDDAAGARTTVAVRTTTFAHALAESPAPFEVVKMDCEGGEYGLVYASDKADWATVHRIVMEYHPVQGESWAQLRDWFAAAGFRVARHESSDPGLGTAWLERAHDYSSDPADASDGTG